MGQFLLIVYNDNTDCEVQYFLNKIIAIITIFYTKHYDLKTNGEAHEGLPEL